MKEKYERICVLLRPGDFETLRSHVRVSVWVRELVAKCCDELRAEQRRQEKARAKAWQAMIEDI